MMLKESSIPHEYYFGNLPGTLQYKKDPTILANIKTKKCINNCGFILEHCNYRNLRRVIPHTKIISKWELILVMKREMNNEIWLKAALQNKDTQKIALMTSTNLKINILSKGNRAIKSYDPKWFIGFYRMCAPMIFWIELKNKLSSKNTMSFQKDKLLSFQKDKLLSFYMVFNKLYKQHVKLGITTRPLGHRLQEYNTFGPVEYYKVARFECDVVGLRNIEKQCLDATMEYLPEPYKTNCPNVEWRIGNKKEIWLWCMSQFPKGGYIVDPSEYRKKNPSIKEECGSCGVPKNYFDEKDEGLNKNDIINQKRNKLQNEYLKEIIYELHNNHKVLCVAPTGFGKTHIFYKLINEKKYNNIIVFSPRKLLNKQNSGEKYSDILEQDNYIKILFNTSKKEKIMAETNLLIYSCYQSGRKLYGKIKDLDIDLIVFDEAHFIQTWELKSEESFYANYFMQSSKIKNRLFLTATTTEILEDNKKDLFGKIIEKVKVYELIADKILCGIETITKQINTQRKNHDLSLLIQKSMIKHNKKKGIIYVNTQNNAVKLYKFFEKRCLKAYIYISNKVELHNKYDDNIKHFENNEEPCIIITCKKIDYGYDCIWIDFICFADPKQGYIDIRQTMGRGLRNNIVEYPEKILHVLLPIYMDEIGESKDYRHITAYLKYIVEDAGQDIVKGNNRNGCQLMGTIKNEINEIKNKTYEGDDIPLEICKELSTTYYGTYHGFKRFLRQNKIYDEETYNESQPIYDWMPTIGKLRSSHKNFCFQDIHPHREQFYSTKEECMEKKKVVMILLKKKLGSNRWRRMVPQKRLEKIHEMDKKIPNINLDLYYV